MHHSVPVTDKAEILVPRIVSISTRHRIYVYMYVYTYAVLWRKPKAKTNGSVLTRVFVERIIILKKLLCVRAYLLQNNSSAQWLNVCI